MRGEVAARDLDSLGDALERNHFLRLFRCFRGPVQIGDRLLQAAVSTVGGAAHTHQSHLHFKARDGAF